MGGCGLSRRYGITVSDRAATLPGAGPGTYNIKAGALPMNHAVRARPRLIFNQNSEIRGKSAARNRFGVILGSKF